MVIIGSNGLTKLCGEKQPFSAQIFRTQMVLVLWPLASCGLFQTGQLCTCAFRWLLSFSKVDSLIERALVWSGEQRMIPQQI